MQESGNACLNDLWHCASAFDNNKHAFRVCASNVSTRVAHQSDIRKPRTQPVHRPSCQCASKRKCTYILCRLNFQRGCAMFGWSYILAVVPCIKCELSKALSRLVQSPCWLVDVRPICNVQWPDTWWALSLKETYLSKTTPKRAHLFYYYFAITSTSISHSRN